MFCTKCGKKNPEDARFCAFCGAKLLTRDAGEEDGQGGGQDTGSSAHLDAGAYSKHNSVQDGDMASGDGEDDTGGVDDDGIDADGVTGDGVEDLDGVHGADGPEGLDGADDPSGTDFLDASENQGGADTDNAYDEPVIGRHAASEPQAQPHHPAGMTTGNRAPGAGMPQAGGPRGSGEDTGTAPSSAQHTERPIARPAPEQRVYRQSPSGRTAGPAGSGVPRGHAPYVRPAAPPGQLPPSRYARPIDPQEDAPLDVPRGGMQGERIPSGAPGGRAPSGATGGGSLGGRTPGGVLSGGATGGRTPSSGAHGAGSSGGGAPRRPAAPSGHPGREGYEPPKRPPQHVRSRVQQLPYDDDEDDYDDDDEGGFFSPLVIAAMMVLVAALACAGWLFLTGSGQMWRASMGMDAPASAYWSLGDRFVGQGQTQSAVNAYERALRLDSNNFDGTLKLAKALELAGNAERAIRAYSKCISINDKNPEPYRRLAQVFAREGMDAQRAKIIQEGIAKTGDTSLSDQVSSLAPPAPKANPEPGYYTGQQNIVLSSSGGSNIYYTLDGSKPDESSQEYKNPIMLGEGEHTLRTVAYLAGIVGQEAAYSYKVELPPPDAPVLNPPEGTYTARNGESITLTISADPDATILYTTDGSTPDADSPRYTGPITLTTGRHTVIAGAISPGGKAGELVKAEYNIKK